MEMPSFHVSGFGDGEPESLIDLLVIEAVDWVVWTLLVFSLENFKTNQSVATIVFGLKAEEWSILDIT